MNAQIPSTSPRDPFGPSDSSDSASDRPAEPADTDSAGTGERASAEPPSMSDDDALDVDTDREVSADEAGLSRSPADPVRNGGLPDQKGEPINASRDDSDDDENDDDETNP